MRFDSASDQIDMERLVLEQYNADIAGMTWHRFVLMPMFIVVLAFSVTLASLRFLLRLLLNREQGLDVSAALLPEVGHDERD